jgi:hypothetical protein
VVVGITGVVVTGLVVGVPVPEAGVVVTTVVAGGAVVPPVVVTGGVVVGEVAGGGVVVTVVAGTSGAKLAVTVSSEFIIINVEAEFLLSTSPVQFTK